MKNILYTVFIMSLLASCKSNTKQAANDTAKMITKIGITDSLIQRFKPFIQGIWVKSDYVEGLSKTKSPLLLHPTLKDFASFQIRMPSTAADSILVGYSLNNHEGNELSLYFKTGQKPTSLKINYPDYKVKGNFYELGYRVKNNDTSLFLYHYNKTKRLLDSVRYTKVANKAADEEDAAWGIQYITNKKLIGGNYATTDSIGAPMKLTFSDDGRISGLKNFNHYFINTDFELLIDNNLDEIGFDESDFKHVKWYAFKFQADTLNLYEVKENADSTSIALGELKYKLVKQK